MTIDVVKAGRHLGTAFLVLAIWFGGLALLTLLLEPTPTVMVFGSRDTIIKATVQADVALLEVDLLGIVARSQRSGFVRAIYASGAWLVLPAPQGGCLGLSGVPGR